MTNIDIAKAYIKAAQTGDEALFAEIVSPDIIWHQPGNNQFSGSYQGISAVGALLDKMMDVSQDTFTIARADHYMENGEWVAIQLVFSGQREGYDLNQPGVDLLRIEGGKIIEVRLFSSDPAAEDLFWGQ